jgi:hypothetical protein
MPIYLYQHPETDEVLEVFQKMNDEHKYIDSSGVDWNRIFLSPNAAIDLDADPFDNSKFIEKTANAGTMGEMWDRSAEMSSKRASQNDGVDPLRKNYFKDYSAKRGGSKHLSDDS